MLQNDYVKAFLGLERGIQAAFEDAQKQATGEAGLKKDPNQDQELFSKLVRAKSEIEKAARIGSGDGWKLIGMYAQCTLA